MLSRNADRPWAIPLAGSGLAAGTAALYIAYGWPGLIALPAGAFMFLAVTLGTGVFAQFSAGIRLSLRWKITGAISLMLAILLGVSLATLVAANSMHNDVHAIQGLIETAPRPEIEGIVREAQGPQGELMRRMQERLDVIPAALDRLENRQHLILTWVPVGIFGGGVVALALGMALSSSLIRPIGMMSEATRRIAGGDFSSPVQVHNGDELGELAVGLNNAARDLEELQEARLAEERARSLQARMAQAGLAQEEERRRISRELHDGLGPSLADLSNRLSVCRQLVRVDPQEAEKGLDESTSLLRGHIGEIRELINQLRPLALDQLGLAGALRQHIQRFGEDSGIETTLKVSEPISSNPLTEVTIYRVVQESLTNIRKHAEATSANVELSVSDGHLQVTVADNGKGLDSELMATSPEAGLGFTSMRERAELVGGTFAVESRLGNGCKTVLRIPVKG